MSGFYTMPRDMIEALWMHAGNHVGDGWREVTTPRIGDKVLYNLTGETGVIAEIFKDYSLRKYDEFGIKIGDEIVECGLEDIEIKHDTVLPARETMWKFGDPKDDKWLKDNEGIYLMSDCGFRIYEHAELGYFFGLDGGNYDLYERHWLPLYNVRELQWHGKEAEKISAFRLEAEIAHPNYPNYPHTGIYEISLPATPEAMAAVIRNIGIRNHDDVTVLEVYPRNNADNNVCYWLQEALFTVGTPHSLEELNDLAVKICNMDDEQRKTFAAVLQARWDSDTLADMLRLADNLDSYYLETAAVNAEVYGEFLLSMEQDDPSGRFARLEESENPDDRLFVDYIDRLAKCADRAAYARMIAKEESGVFTDFGYLRKTGERSVQMTQEKEAVVTPEKPPVKVKVKPSLKETLRIGKQKSLEQFGGPTSLGDKNREGETR